ncbi:MAG TPA: thioredoxin domain-containing protein [Gammaproteobacteria bacterium]|nr:thioredoxin domain-containing protein [Gammaproteobacteria bacterium]
MTSAARAHRNALAGETSPYLLQHAGNPVDWHPWGDEALKLARETGRPILLSVGYSACHWCHVMAHESFEDEETAALMNEHFVNIKVDREERPDLDKIYQTAQYLLTRRSGGWPLTMFLTHDDHVPFYGGTYFPGEPRWGMPSFKDLLRHIAEVYRERLPELREQNQAVLEALRGQMSTQNDEDLPAPSSEPLLKARRDIENGFDAVDGGFGAAPKFPHPPMLERLLRHHAASVAAGESDAPALHMAVFTLRKMAEGGMYDQIGGGFARYSVDAHWMIPHFEKMLYDNAQLLGLYVQAWQITGDPCFRQIAMETADWVTRDMQSPEGGYYSSLDADSEGHEGKFYAWSREEVRALLTDAEYAVLAPHYGLSHAPNFEGQWHFHVMQSLEDVAAAAKLEITQARELLNSARAKLLTVRNKRIWPGRDEKILTSWNALMIKTMALAGFHLDRQDYLDSARRALDFLRARMWQGNRLLATYKDNHAHLNAYLDDYAFLIDALLMMLSVHWRDEDLAWVTALADVLLEQFEDKEKGGFYFTAHDHEQLILRSKTCADEALPAGNGIAALVLGRLGHLLGNERYLLAAERTLKSCWLAILQHPSAHLTLLSALEELLQPPQTVVLRGTGDELIAWQRIAMRGYVPRRQVFAIPTDAQNLPSLLAAREPSKSGTVAYVCEGTHCEAPVSKSGELEKLVEKIDG